LLKKRSSRFADTMAGRWRRCDHQNTSASKARIAQIASPLRQLPVCTMTCGASEAAMAAPPMIEVTYKPMHNETLLAKRDLINAGINA
jgi:hypothetical protein